jgi:hypothetical protein
VAGHFLEVDRFDLCGVDPDRRDNQEQEREKNPPASEARGGAPPIRCVHATSLPVQVPLGQERQRNIP